MAVFAAIISFRCEHIDRYKSSDFYQFFHIDLFSIYKLFWLVLMLRLLFDFQLVFLI